MAYQPSIPKDEASRMAMLMATGILDTPKEDAFEDFVRVAAELCNAPVALVSLVDANRQWFKAKVGLDASETRREDSFCAQAIVEADTLIVHDTHADARFSSSPYVQGDGGFRFYAAVPLLVGDGSAVGTLCVLDRKPRELTVDQRAGLQMLGAQISLELRRRAGIREAPPPKQAAGKLPMVGDNLGTRWRIERKIGSGGFGAIFEASRGVGERAAVKVLTAEAAGSKEMVERFVREAHVLMELKGEHVARLYEVGNLSPAHGSLPFLVLEYLDGVDLDGVLMKFQKVGWRQAAGWIADACDGVAEAHDRGVVHRDIKPANIFLAIVEGKEEPVVKVLDFGVAKKEYVPSNGLAGTVARLTGDRAVIGTPYYMSPEQLLSSANVDGRTDVWAMGAVLYELLTGKVPFSGGNSMELCAAVLKRPPLPLRVSLPEVPDSIDLIVKRCLEKHRDNRFATIHEVGAALRRAIANEPLDVIEPGAPR